MMADLLFRYAKLAQIGAFFLFVFVVFGVCNTKSLVIVAANAPSSGPTPNLSLFMSFFLSSYYVYIYIYSRLSFTFLTVLMALYKATIIKLEKLLEI